MSENKAIEKAARKFMSAIKGLSSESAAMPQVIESFMDGVGGPKELGRMLLNDFNRTRGEGLTEDQSLNFEYKDAVIQKYYQMIMSQMQLIDDKKTIDASGLTDEDLVATLSSIAFEQVRTNKEYRDKLIEQAIDADPEVVKRIMELGGAKVLEVKDNPFEELEREVEEEDDDE